MIKTFSFKFYDQETTKTKQRKVMCNLPIYAIA